MCHMMPRAGLNRCRAGLTAQHEPKQTKDGAFGGYFVQESKKVRYNVLISGSLVLHPIS